MKDENLFMFGFLSAVFCIFYVKLSGSLFANRAACLERDENGFADHGPGRRIIGQFQDLFAQHSGFRIHVAADEIDFFRRHGRQRTLPAERDHVEIPSGNLAVQNQFVIQDSGTVPAADKNFEAVQI